MIEGVWKEVLVLSFVTFPLVIELYFKEGNAVTLRVIGDGVHFGVLGPIAV